MACIYPCGNLCLPSGQVQQLVNAPTPRITADPAISSDSCSPNSDGVTYLHLYCFSMRVLNEDGLVRDAYLASRDVYSRMQLLEVDDIPELI